MHFWGMSGGTCCSASLPITMHGRECCCCGIAIFKRQRKQTVLHAGLKGSLGADAGSQPVWRGWLRGPRKGGAMGLKFKL